MGRVRNFDLQQLTFMRSFFKASISNPCDILLTQISTVDVYCCFPVTFEYLDYFLLLKKLE